MTRSAPGALTPNARCFVIAAIYAAVVMSVGLAIYGLGAGAEVSAARAPRSGGLVPAIEEVLGPQPRVERFPSASQAVLLTFSVAVAVGLLAVGGRVALPWVTCRRLVVGAAVALALLFAVMIWPTRWAYHRGPGGQLVRIDRISGQAEYVRPTNPRR